MGKRIIIHLLIGATIFLSGASLHDFGLRPIIGNFIAYGGILYAGLSVCFITVKAIMDARSISLETQHSEDNLPEKVKSAPIVFKTFENKIKINGIKTFNAIQNKILLLGCSILFLLFIFPPWEASNANGNVKAIGHYIIFSGPDNILYPALDISRLIVEMIALCLVFGVLLFFTRSEES